MSSNPFRSTEDGGKASGPPSSTEDASPPPSRRLHAESTAHPTVPAHELAGYSGVLPVGEGHLAGDNLYERSRSGTATPSRPYYSYSPAPPTPSALASALYQDSARDDGRYATYSSSTAALVAAALENAATSGASQSGRTHSGSRARSTTAPGTVAPSIRSVQMTSNGSSPYINPNSTSRHGRSASGNPSGTFLMDMDTIPPPRDDPGYPAWSSDPSAPLSIPDIRGVFARLEGKFGFQRSSVHNQTDALLALLESRASRMSASRALSTVHADYIGGEHANYRRWCFSTLLGRDRSIATTWPKPSANNTPALHKPDSTPKKSPSGIAEGDAWRERMRSMDPYQQVGQVALYLCIWGEAGNVRHLPECLAWLFHVADAHVAGGLLPNGDPYLPAEPPAGAYLNQVVRPIYRYIRSQGYERIVDGTKTRWRRKEGGYTDKVGYDDLNELFWSTAGLRRIRLDDGSRIMSLEPHLRWSSLSRVQWDRAGSKTFLEGRTVLHLLPNYSRIWVLHLSVFYYYTISTTMWWSVPKTPDVDPGQMLAVTGFGGSIAVLVVLLSTSLELYFLPAGAKAYGNGPKTPSADTPGAKAGPGPTAVSILLTRLFFLLLLLIIVTGPGLVMLLINPPTTSVIRIILGALTFGLGILATFYLALTPSADLFRAPSSPRLLSTTFSNSVAPLKPSKRLVSLLLWLCIFGSKYVESYYFLTLSFKDTFRALSTLPGLNGVCTNFGLLCNITSSITLAMAILLDLLLFLLDTYLWYILWGAIFSVSRAVYLGNSVWKPWADIFQRLPRRLYAKVLLTPDVSATATRVHPRILMGQIWNALAISMFREHLIPETSLPKFLYHQQEESIDPTAATATTPVLPRSGAQDPWRDGLVEPEILTRAKKTGEIDHSALPNGGEARRRLQFFAQSLGHELPEALPVREMPTFTVLTPHYTEKILLPLTDILREKGEEGPGPGGLPLSGTYPSGSALPSLTLLDYLKGLHADEWRNFVEDSKALAQEREEEEEDDIDAAAAAAAIEEKLSLPPPSLPTNPFGPAHLVEGAATPPRRAWVEDGARPVPPSQRLGLGPGEEHSGTTPLSWEDGSDETSDRLTPTYQDPSLTSPAPHTIHPTEAKEMSAATAGAFEAYGFHRATPEFTMRTRIWASVRSQTLYRTVSGFMNYARALRLLHRLERPVPLPSASSPSSLHGSPLMGYAPEGDAEEELETDRCARRKFRMVVAMQRYAHFDAEEREAVEFLLSAYPDLCIAYLEEEPASLPEEDGENRVYSVLVDGRCVLGPDGRRVPSYRIQLPGHPVLGDGKADNQNHALIFSRGEFLQMIDANQDNYLEEALKIRNVLGEFELEIQRGGPNGPVTRTHGGANDLEGRDAHHEAAAEADAPLDSDFSSPDSIPGARSRSRAQSHPHSHSRTYVDGQPQDPSPPLHHHSVRASKGSTYNLTPSPYDSASLTPPPVAIVGTREFIFSENVGLLGDVAAGKEATFGTQNQRLLAQLGGRLHYGHPDFLNAIFMMTRGGVSKATKGLHLNEDIYAGMQAMVRGGRIKHAEYFQCGKGRDLGFNSVMSFVTKIGSGMGEQFLSREHYWLGSQLPLDRLLTFYYAHPGFQINNICISLATRLFLLLTLLFGVLFTTVAVCSSVVDPSAGPTGCFNVWPVIGWLKRCTIAILIVLVISFIPLFLQVLTEQGFRRGTIRLSKHILSLSPFLEVFIAQLYAHSTLENLAFGGARYLGTARSLSTRRIPFSVLYSRYSASAVHVGSRLLLLLVYITLVLWIPHFIYFWLVAASMALAPFLFNPHQFSLSEFLLDYQSWWTWLLSSRVVGSSRWSWSVYVREGRAKMVGTAMVGRLVQPGEPSWEQAVDTEAAAAATAATSGAGASGATTKLKLKRTGTTTAHAMRIPEVARPSMASLWVPELVVPTISAAFLVLAYGMVKTGEPSGPGPKQGGIGGVQRPTTGGGCIRILIAAVIPFLLSAIIYSVFLLLAQPLRLCMGDRRTRVLTTRFVRFSTVVVGVVVFLGLWWLDGWRGERAVLALVGMLATQRVLLRALTLLFLGREPRGTPSASFWVMPRRVVREAIEASYFALDVILGHFLLIFLVIPCLIPFMDRVHTMMLLWISPRKQVKTVTFNVAPKRRMERMQQLVSSALLFVFLSGILLTLIMLPAISPNLLPTVPIQPVI